MGTIKQVKDQLTSLSPQGGGIPGGEQLKKGSESLKDKMPKFLVCTHTGHPSLQAETAKGMHQPDATRHISFPSTIAPQTMLVSLTSTWTLMLFLLSHNALGYRVIDPFELNSPTILIILTSFEYGIMSIYSSVI